MWLILIQTDYLKVQRQWNIYLYSFKCHIKVLYYLKSMHYDLSYNHKLLHIFIFREDLENVSDRNLTIASSLATVLSKTFQLKSPGIQSHIEKCPTFVSKDKRPKIFGHRNKKTVQLQGHHFELKHYYQLTHCNHSQQLIWGIGPQGYKCSCKYCYIFREAEPSKHFVGLKWPFKM